MSRIGVVVSGKTSTEIFEAAQLARTKLNIGLTGRLAIENMEWLLEKRVRPVYGVEIDIVADNYTSLQGVYAAYAYTEGVLRIKESVIRKSKADDSEAIFTICHEIGHVCMHSNPQLFRRDFPKHIPRKLCDPEWQADRFAIEFLVDRNRLMEMFKEKASAAAYFRVPLQQLKIYFAELQEEGVIERKKTTKAQDYLDAIQGDLDF